MESILNSEQGFGVLPGPCGHSLHKKCYDVYRSHGNYKCPVCAKTYATINTTLIWAHYDAQIEAQPMPDEYKEMPITFLCNDCNIKTDATLNLIGYKCPHCSGYNTVSV